MRVLFVSGIDGFCHRYQVLHRAAQVASLGGSATVRHFADPRLPQDVAGHDALFVYRVPATEHVRTTLDTARARGVPAIGAIDDLVFVDDPALLPPLDRLAPDERERWRSGVRRYGATLSWCDAFVGPTEPLVEAARSFARRAYLHRNSIAPAELELARRARAAAPPRAAGDVVLGYFSGTPTHDEDFVSIAAPLASLLRAEPRVRLLLVGPLALPAELGVFAERVERRPLVPWHLLPAAMTQADVSLAPLAARPFAAAKGEIKYLEAAALGIPTVASPTSAYRHAIRDGWNGRLAGDPAEWRAALAELACDGALRARLGAAAAEDVRRRYAEPARAAELAAILEDVLRRHARPAQTLVQSPIEGTFDVEPPARHALEADARPALAPGAARDVSPPLGDGARVVQRFRTSSDGLVRVDVHTVTYGQELDHELVLTLRRDDGTTVASARVAAAEAPDRGWLALDVDAAAGRSAGRVYEIEVAARGAGARNALSLGLAGVEDRAPDARGDGPLGTALLDDAPLSGPLALRAFAAWTDASAAPLAPRGAAPGRAAPRTPAEGPHA